MHEVLQTEYLVEDDPRTLWLALEERFDYQKDIFFLKQDMSGNIHACKALCR